MSMNKIDTDREVFIDGFKDDGLCPHGLPIKAACGEELELSAAEGVAFLADLREDRDALKQIEDTIQSVACVEVDGVEHPLLTGFIDITTFRALAARHMIRHRGESIATDILLLLGALEVSKAEDVAISWFKLAEDRRGRNANDK